MAILTWIGTTNTNWGTASNWSLGTVPTASDDVIFNASSPNCNVNVSGLALSIDFTNYSNTITMTNGIKVSGNVTLGSSMTIDGTGTLTVDGNSTLTSNGKQWNLPLLLSSGYGVLASAKTFTLNGDWYVTDLTLGDGFSFNNILNGGRFYVSGNLGRSGTGPNFSGTTEIIFIGSGNWFGAVGNWANSFTINTIEGLTISSVSINGGTFSYIQGDVKTTGTQTIRETVLNINDGFTFSNLALSNNTVTLASNLKVNNLTFPSGSLTTVNGFRINIFQNLTTTSSGGSIGTTKFVMTGTGTWSSTSTGLIGNDLEFNTTGTVSISGDVSWGQNSATLKYTANTGTVVTSGSKLKLVNSAANVFLDTNSLMLNNIEFNFSNTTRTYTLLSDLNVGGLIRVGNGVTFVAGNYSINSYGGFFIGVVSGGSYFNMNSGSSPTLNLLGGTWSQIGVSTNRINTNINGNIGVSGSVTFDSATMSYIGGTPNVTGSTLNVGSTVKETYLSTAGMTWSNLNVLSSTSVTLRQNLNVGSTFSTTGNVYVRGLYTLNTNGLFVNGGYIIEDSVSSPTNLPTINLTGGSWQALNSASDVRIPLQLNGNVTIVGNVYYQLRTLSWTGLGTITTTGSTLNIKGTSTINTGNLTWNNINFTNGTVVLSSNLIALGNVSQSGGNLVLNGNTLYIGGNLTLGFSTNAFTGTTQLIMNGTGTMSTQGTITTGRLSNNLTINTTGTVSMSGLFPYYGGTFSYSNGTFLPGTSSLWIAFGPNTPGFETTTLNLGNTNIYNFRIDTTGSVPSVHRVILSSNLNISNEFLLSSGSVIINGSTVSIGGNLRFIASNGNTVSGTSNFLLNGTGTWSSLNQVTLTNNTTINTSGTISMTGSIYYSTGTFSYITGTVNAGNSTLNIMGSARFDTDRGGGNRINWNNIQYRAINTCTLLSDLYVYGLFSTPVNGGASTATTFVGSKVIYCYGGLYHYWVMSGAATIYLKGGMWSSPGIQTLNTFIDGDITIDPNPYPSGSVQYATGTLTYLSGIVTTTGSTVYFAAGTYNIGSNVIFNNLNTTGTGGTLVLNDSLNCINFVPSTAGANYTYNGSDINVFGNFTNNTLSIGGSSKIFLKGTGTWSGTGTTKNSLIIDTTGTMSTSGNIYYSTGKISYLSGTISTGTSTLNLVGSTTLDTGTPSVQHPNGLPWFNVKVNSGSAVITLLSNLTVNGLFSSLLSGTTFIGGNYYNCYGGVYIAYATSGVNPSQFNLYGGTWSGAGVGQTMRNRVNIYGDSTIINTVSFTDIRHYSGTVTTTGSTLRIIENNYIETAGITWSGVTLAANVTTTLGANLNIDGLLFNGAVSAIDGNFNINCNGGLTVNNSLYSNSIISPTLNLINGTWSGTSILYLNTNLGGGNLNISGTVRLGSSGFVPTLTYTGTGTVNTANSTLSIESSANLDTDKGGGNRINWNNAVLGNFTYTINFVSNFYATGNVSSTGTNVWNNNTVYVGGNLTFTTISGSSSIVLNGTGTWSGVSSANLEINSPTGTINFGSSLGIGGGKTFKWTAGTVSAGTSLFQVSTNATLINIGNNIQFYDFFQQGKFVANTDIYTTRNYTVYQNYGTGGLTSSNNIYIGGNYTLSGIQQGMTYSLSNFVMNGTGTLQIGLSGARFYNSITFNSATGSITVSGIIPFQTNTITYVPGSTPPITTGSTLSITNYGTLNTGGMTWAAVSLIQNSNISSFSLPTRLNADIIETVFLYNTVNSSFTFGGSGGFNTNTFRNATSSVALASFNRDIVFTTGVTYSINSNLSFPETNTVGRTTFKSSSSTTRAIFTLNPSATQNMSYVNGTRMDSSGGQTIYAQNGLLTNNINWSIYSGAELGNFLSLF